MLVVLSVLVLSVVVVMAAAVAAVVHETNDVGSCTGARGERDRDRYADRKRWSAAAAAPPKNTVRCRRCYPANATRCPAAAAFHALLRCCCLGAGLPPPCRCPAAAL